MNRKEDLVIMTTVAAMILTLVSLLALSVADLT